MIFGRKKESAIDRRLQELRKQMSKVNTDIKSLSCFAKADAPPSLLDNAKLHLPESGAKNGIGAPLVNQPDGVKTGSPAADDLLSQEPNSEKDSLFSRDKASGEGSGDMPLFEPRAQLSPTGREKFANYFMAGHFTNLRPLRQEKRVVRNKAIIMSVLVVIALVWLFYFFYNQ